MSNTNRVWIGVDLDGTLAYYDGWVGPEHIGEPIAPMVERVRYWLSKGVNVKIFTARVGPNQLLVDVYNATRAINAWCVLHIGRELPLTATKDLLMKELWDDRCVCVERNTGEVLACNQPADTTKDSFTSTS